MILLIIESRKNYKKIAKIYLKRFEDKGFQLVGMKLLMAEDEVRFAAKTTAVIPFQKQQTN